MRTEAGAGKADLHLTRHNNLNDWTCSPSLEVTALDWSLLSCAGQPMERINGRAMGVR